MNKPRLHIALAVLSFIGAALIFNACTVDNLTKDLNISLSSDFLVNPITIQVADALSNKAITDDITVTIEGRDKDKIYSLLGEKKISLIGNIFALSVKKSDAPTEVNPLQFTIVLQSGNFVTKRVDYNITNAAPRVDAVKLINVNTPPASVSVNQTSFSSAAGTGTSQTITFSSPLTNGKDENAVIKINPGTVLMTADGGEVSGTVQSTLLHSDAKNISVATAIPNWGEVVAIKDAQGKDLGTTSINPTSFFELKMTAGDKVIEKFSAPIEASVIIDDRTINPITGKTIQAGDFVSIFSHSDGQEGWNFEGKATVSAAGNGLFKVGTQLNHLSTYAYSFRREDDNFENYCTSTIKVNSNIVDEENDDVCTLPAVQYHYDIVDGTSPTIEYAEGESRFGNNTLLGKFTYPCGAKLKLIIYQNEREEILLADFNIANGMVVIPADKLKTNSVVAKLKVAAICGTGNCTTPDGESCNLTSSVTYIPSSTLLCAEVPNPDMSPNNPDQNLDWRPLVNLKPDAAGGKFATGCARGLERGKWYDFGIAVKNYNNTGRTEILRYSTCFQFPATDITGTGSTKARPYFYIPFQDKITVNVNSPKWGVSNCLVTSTSVNNVYDLDFTKNLDGSPAGGFQLPCKVCCKISKSFSSFVSAK